MDLHNNSISTILDNLSDAFMIMEVNGRINYFNTVAAKITGYTNHEAKG